MASSPFDPLSSLFPLLTSSGYRITSPADISYNCIAWAVGETQRWWEPDPMNLYYWPPGVPRLFTIEAFTEAYRTLGFELCAGPELEAGVEKVAVFAMNGRPTHAARQLQDGSWTSKLGVSEDLEHSSLRGVAGPAYGEPVRVLSRSRR